MPLRKCSRCEVNYLREGETLCAICASACKRPKEEEAEPVLCGECGEQPVFKQELCEACYLEQRRQAELETMADKIRQGETEKPLEDLLDDDPDADGE